jgi:hypothetical protein
MKDEEDTSDLQRLILQQMHTLQTSITENASERRNEIGALREKIESLHVSVSKLEARFMVPGESLICQQHAGTVKAIASDLESIKKRQWVMVGTVSAIIFVLQYALPAVIHLITKKP